MKICFASYLQRLKSQLGYSIKMRKCIWNIYTFKYIFFKKIFYQSIEVSH